VARKRLLVETSDQVKAALLDSVEAQGVSLADWLEEQITTSIPSVSRTLREGTAELTDPGELGDPEVVLAGVRAQDWAFTDEDTRYLTHDLHPYPAKFIPQIPAHLIASLSVRGDVVLDPFGGSGTTAVEAVRLGRRAVSLDANPLSSLIGRVKTGFMTPEVRADLEQLVAAVEGHVITPQAGRSAWGKGLMERYHRHVPDIPNMEKWFSETAAGELALLRFLIEETTSELSRDAALLALSRIVVRVSNQESETRYVAVAKSVAPTPVLRPYLQSLKTVTRRLETAAVELQYADAKFLTGDSRKDLACVLGENSVDLIVTSPPYPNATDYHLYHRFRLFWLGFDPRELAKIEIGSHLRHQRNDSGFEEYRKDMALVLEGCGKVLQSGRYAVFVVGDALFKGKAFSTSEGICDTARSAGLSVVGVIDRPIHKTKRSFAKPARRAGAEQLVVLQKPNRPVSVLLNPPAYRMWKFEEELRCMEIARLTGAEVDIRKAANPLRLKLNQPALWNLRRLTFTKDFVIGNGGGPPQPTWQKVLENGDVEARRRKDPKYVTHGLHAFKGKFYPQLAKSLLNISGVGLGGRVLDPFCGSGTFLVEGMLNGFAAYGCDLNPLAAKIARSKTAILCLPRDVADLAMRSLLERIARRRGTFPTSLDQFPDETHEELFSWFPEPVLYKLNWLLGQARLFGDPALIDFLEVLISSLIREVCQQDPTDLRIRRRKKALEDAPVFELFRERLEQQYERLLKYWCVAGRQPGRVIPATVREGDSREAGTMAALGLDTYSVDCVVTSPPYATALPYIDTDRLSLLAVMGLTSPVRSHLEENLTGSREIRRAIRQRLEDELQGREAREQLPDSVVRSIRQIYVANKNGEVGFRRANMGALLWRYFIDMRDNLAQVARVLKAGATAFYVVGDSRTNAGGAWVAIETCKHIESIGQMIGLKLGGTLPIDVTIENYKHIRNAITKNRIVSFEKG
jgi:DNA modification methylase